MHLPEASLTSHITYVLSDTHHYPSADGPSVPVTPQHQSSFRHNVDDILQIILKCRKSWKTLKGKSEAVWPPYLEATMLKALQEYEPDDSRETRILGRYPMRNRFISDYIHSTTGKYRSAKQVGSRLQQLRDTPEGRELIDTLTRCYHTRTNARTFNARQPVYSSSSPAVSTISCDSPSSSSSDSPATPTSPAMRSFPAPIPRQPAESRMPVYIDILPQQPRSFSSVCHPSSATAASMPSSGTRPVDAGRQIRNIDPTVTFVSPSPVNGKSSYIVLLDGAPVHSEDTMLEYVGPYSTSSTGRSSSHEPVLYNTPLVPRYWDVICEAADPTLYTIVQDVYRITYPVPDRDCIFSATYHFQYHHASAESAPPYGQPSMDVAMSSGGSSMTSTFNSQALQPTDPTRAMFPAPTTYTVPASEGLRLPTQVDQNLFDEPFMLDVTFEQVAFDDFVASMDNPDSFASFDPPPL